jgi:iron complex transport system ATP-binding protein
MLEIKNLDNGYISAGKPVILHHNLNLQILQGQLCLIAGRNGAGKSTLMKIVSGLSEAPAGSVLYNEMDIRQAGAAERAGIISLMQATPPDLSMTTATEAVMSSRQRFLTSFTVNLDKHKAVAMEALKIVGMEKFANHEFSRLSDGEKQKVMLARCLAQETPVIIMDEPLAFLDYPSRREMLDLLSKLCTEKGKTILYSSHDLELALKHCNKLLVLADDNKWQWYTQTSEIDNLLPAMLFKL